MPPISVEFAEALSTINRPNAFFVAGTEEMLAPGLMVQGIGPVALPLLPMQAEQLIAAAERAPYGRGEETVTDLAVRRSWQIGADRFRIAGRHWSDTLNAIVARIAAGLGIEDPIEADLYKLLIYDQGSFFVPHRDTEKVPGMFATLVLVLPSVSQGGELIVRHKEREVRLDLRCEEDSDVAFAAFYADCVHEVLPVSSGYRLVLVYNLVRHGSGRLPEPPDYAAETDALAALLKEWADEPRSPGKDVAEKLIYPLEYSYTPAELGFGALKGADAGIAPVVVAAADRAGCDVHLALITIEESGVAEYNGDYRPYRRDRYRDDDDDEDDEDDSDDSNDDFEVVEVSDRSAVASEWRQPNGEPSALTEIPVMEEEFSPPIEFEDLEPDEQHFHEATGNEGASFERTYRRAALILWPHDRVLAVINQAGQAVTLPFLADLVDRWEAAQDTAIYRQALALADLMMAAWPMGRWYRARDLGITDAGRFLDTLRKLADAPRLAAFLGALAGRCGFDHADSVPVADALLALATERGAALATKLIEGAAEPALAACASLLARLSMSQPQLAVSAARVLVGALPADPARDAALQVWQSGPVVTPGCVVDLFSALGRIDATLAAVTADHVLDWPKTYDFDSVLVPATRTLLGSSETAGQAAVLRLRNACLGHLEERIALPLEPPADWRRDDKVGCMCKDCQALAKFLGDATQKIWVFAAAEPRRRHVEATIRGARCDVDTATERRGSPHKLISTKNQASYKHRCVQRANDLAERDRLAGSSGA